MVRDVGLTGLVRPASTHATTAVGAERLLPVMPELRALLPGGGLRRGATIAVIATRQVTRGIVRGDGAFDAVPRGASGRGPAGRGPAARGSAGRGSAARGPSETSESRPGAQDSPPPASTSVLLALLSAASRAGAWCGVVGLPTLSAVAAAESGISLDRLALVPRPGTEWVTAVAALLDGLDIVVAAPPEAIAPGVAGRLAARARQRGSVLMPYGAWVGADVSVEATRGVWDGLGQGRGRLRCRQLTLRARGRGASSAPREVTLWLPAPTGLFADRLALRGTTPLPGTASPGTGVPGTGVPSTALPGTGVPGTGVPGTGRRDSAAETSEPLADVVPFHRSRSIDSLPIDSLPIDDGSPAVHELAPAVGETG